MVFPFQIYRHFKGGLYLVLNIALAESNFEPTVVYMSLNDGNKVWTRSQSDFSSPVPEGVDNPTGQRLRFELVKNIGSILSQCTTENLIKELKSRPDSLLNEVDFEEFNKQVVLREYILGEIKRSPNENGEYLEPIMSADSIEEVVEFVENNPHRCNKRVKIYKSVIVKMRDFD